MGTQKGSNAKKDPSPTAMKHKSTSNTHPIPRPQKPRRRQEVKKGWEEWEDSLIMALQKEGKIDRQISQYLPGRNESSCRQRRCKLNAQRRSVSAQQEDVLASRAPRKQYWSKTWEDWEDQIIVKHHSAGESWGDISKMLLPRSVGSVRSRWKLFLEPQTQDTVTPQPNSPHTPSTPRPVKVYWKQGEDELLKNASRDRKKLGGNRYTFPKSFGEELYGTLGQPSAEAQGPTQEQQKMGRMGGAPPHLWLVRRPELERDQGANHWTYSRRLQESLA